MSELELTEKFHADHQVMCPHCQLREERDHNELRGLEYKAKCETLLAALREAEPWIGVGPGGPDSQTRMRAVRERVGATLAEVEGEKT